MKQSLDDPAAYPRVYRLRRDVDILWTFSGICGILLSIVSGSAIWNEPNMNPDLRLFFMAWPLFFLLFGVFALIARFQYRFILGLDRIHLSSMLTQREMQKVDIAGVVRVRDEVGERVTLVSKNPAEKDLKFFDYMETDEFFERWLESFRDGQDGPWRRS